MECAVAVESTSLQSDSGWQIGLQPVAGGWCRTGVEEACASLAPVQGTHCLLGAARVALESQGVGQCCGKQEGGHTKGISLPCHFRLTGLTCLKFGACGACGLAWKC